jgi:transcriptional regulator with XRE-family HTH domain
MAGNVKVPNPVDVHVGGRVRLRRSAVGMTQKALAAAIGVTNQQLQKYENGRNRIGASRLHEIARVLRVPVDYLYEGVPGHPDADCAPAMPSAFLAAQGALELMTAYVAIPEPRHRRLVVELARALAGAGAGAEDPALPAARPAREDELRR